MKNSFLITPSIMTCDVLDMRNEIKKLKEIGIKHLHFDFMDAHYVNNLGLSTENLYAIKKEFPELIIDAHCMINDIYNFLEQIKIADYITVHIDSKQNTPLIKIIKKIKNLGCKVGLAVDVDTNLEKLNDYISVLDLITIMSIKPGFAGQSFNQKTWETIEIIKTKISGKDIKLQIDGGVRWENIQQLIEAKINYIVVGSLLFKADNYQEVMKKIYK